VGALGIFAIFSFQLVLYGLRPKQKQTQIKLSTMANNIRQKRKKSTKIYNKINKKNENESKQKMCKSSERRNDMGQTVEFIC